MVAAVLRVSKVRSGGGAYYLEVADGSGTGIEASGRWMGSGPPAWRLSGTVEAADFEAVLSGADPRTSHVLGTSRHRVTVAGFDMTFSAPKSVSLLHALGDPDVSHAVAAGHAGAVGAVMSYVERHALAVRRRGEAPRPVPTEVDGVAAVGFLHRMSRALDPHLHTHVVVANLGRGPEGTWSALDGRGVYAHASAADALYHSHLRHELTRSLGLVWDPPDRGRADIVGISPEARREFSRRAAEIATHLAERQVKSGRAHTVAAHVTRADKDLHLGADDLRPEWKDRALTVGLGPRRLEAVLDRAPRLSVSRASALEQPELPAAAIHALGGLRRTVTRRDVVAAWGRALPGGAPVPAVEEAADRLLEYLAPEQRQRGEHQGPGVAERRHQVPSRELGRGAHRGQRRGDAGSAELSRLLAGRGIGLDRPDGRRPDMGIGFG